MQYFFCFLAALSLLREGQCLNLTLCASTYREPEYTDILVTCGTQNMELLVYLCPVYYAGYNESLLALNSMFSQPDCMGEIDLSTSTPFLKFTFPINESSTCGSKFVITSGPGSGIFSDFSNIQNVNISGIIKSNDPTVGIVTYNQDLVYLYSCSYPLEYLTNNTKLDVTGVSIAIKDNNGSFISTLSITLYSDSVFSQPLLIPESGIKLKTKIYAEVKATNLTDRFNVLLDRCYASTSSFPTNSTYYDLFVGCYKDQQTTLILNGDDQIARFSFEAFRFTEHKNLHVSTFYLHCITRLCDKSSCNNFKPCESLFKVTVKAQVHPNLLKLLLLKVTDSSQSRQPGGVAGSAMHCLSVSLESDSAMDLPGPS
ncbi:zona pellucida-like domain-containing protein 1 [Latimeria chalumnae]|uniref:zona pellucida-like domain-containing protein 1 n=1 Tax=Latimeria chalumnae TaxID=7897 RepID=UPI00313AA169